MTSDDPGHIYDVVVVGSGFGGAMAARSLLDEGLDVLMLERGDWVRRGERNRDLTLAWTDRSGYSRQTPYRVEGETSQRLGSFHCVGGPSVYYGAVSLRLREEDFRGSPEITGGLGWPFDYATLEPHYGRAEELLSVSGDTSSDPTEPPRGRPLPPPGLDLHPTSLALRDVALHRGLHPFRLPMALNDDGSRPGARCVACGTCDGFACFIGAKNDLATVVIPDLVSEGMRLRTGTVAVGVQAEGGRVHALHAVDRGSGERLRFRAHHFVLAAGALGTPHLLLASGLQDLNPAGRVVGRHLMRHCNAIVAGLAPPPLGEPDDFRKQIGIHDYYFGDPAATEPRGKLGAVQQIRATRVGLAELALPGTLVRRIRPIVDRAVAFIVLAEDQPRPENRVFLDPRRSDPFGRPLACIHHRYTERDRAARRVLADRACGLLRDLGVPFTVRKSLTTFSHALGTVRMGHDPDAFPVSAAGRFRGLANLWITDASVFPTGGAVNPSLTVAANALRVGANIAREGAVGRTLPSTLRRPAPLATSGVGPEGAGGARERPARRLEDRVSEEPSIGRPEDGHA